MAERTRVLVVTTNPSLVIGLTFAGQDYEVDSQPELDEPVDADVVVLDVDDLELESSIASLGDDRPPVLVITQSEWDELPDLVAVVPRPFTLDDLVDRIERSVYGGEEDVAGDAAADADEAAVAPPVAEVVVEPADEAVSVDAREDGPPEATDVLPSGHEEGSGERDPESTGSRQPSLVSRLFGRVAGSTSSSERLPEEDVPPGAAAGDPGFGEPEPEPVEPEPVEPEPVEPEPEPVEPEPEPDEGPLPASVRQVVTRPADDAARAGATAVRSRARWFARRAPTRDSAQQDLRSRLARTLTAANELERLCEDLPMLRSRHRFVHGIVADVAEQLGADSVGFWRRPAAGEGWQVVAHLGLSAHAATLVVPPDQPLFYEVEVTGGGLLIDPVDALQAAVAGIGGAHTASFMAAAVAIGPGDFGIIAVGRNAPLDGDDLDLLVDIAQEAAPGLAMAEQLERLVALSDPGPDALR